MSALFAITRPCAVPTNHAPHTWTESADGSAASDTRYACAGVMDDKTNDNGDWDELFLMLSNSPLTTEEGTSRLRIIASVVDDVLSLGFTRPPM